MKLTTPRPSRRLPALALLLAATTVLVAGCGAPRHGSRSTWALLTQDRHSWSHHQARTVRLLGGHNDWRDVAETAQIFADGPPEGFGVIAEDLGEIFSPIFSLEELSITLRLLR